MLGAMMLLVRLGAALGLTGVALGAFGAHALRDRLAGSGMEIWRTATLYHLIHAVALVAVALSADRLRAARAVCWLFAGGIVVFAGSLYLLALTGVRWLGAITPLGGAAFLAGWLILAVATSRRT